MHSAIRLLAFYRFFDLLRLAAACASRKQYSVKLLMYAVVNDVSIPSKWWSLHMKSVTSCGRGGQLEAAQHITKSVAP
jgi:hypothetical protein